jgi:hypothetical protein
LKGVDNLLDRLVSEYLKRRPGGGRLFVTETEVYARPESGVTQTIVIFFEGGEGNSPDFDE